MQNLKVRCSKIKKIEEIKSFTSLSKNYLQNLSDIDFKKLLRRINIISNDGKKQIKRTKRFLKNKRTPYGSKYKFPKTVLACRKKQNIILDTFAPERNLKWFPAKDRKDHKTIINIENFSFLDFPQQTLNTLVNLAKHENHDINAVINFNDEYILDIAPYIIWGIMYQSMFPFSKGGKMTNRIKAVLKAVGVQEFLGSTDIVIPKDISPLLIKQKNNFGEKQLLRRDFSCSTIEKTKNELTNKLNEWLKQANLSLTEDGEAQISGIVNEVLDNAERHGSDQTNNGNWAVAGVMQKKNDTDFYCYLAFVNTGKTIASTIKNADNPRIKKDLNNYIDKHAGLLKRYDRNALATLYALQDSVSCKTLKNNIEIKGGFGLMDTIEFVNILGFSSVDRIKPSICIISGDSCILFREKYHFCSSQKPRRQFFNNTNVVDNPPDDSYVFKLENSFPGTIITTRFVLDSNVTEKYNKAK